MAALRATEAKLESVRWPARIAAYVRALLTTDLVANLGCERDILKARSYGQADIIGGNQVCTETANTANADTIRSLLRLPLLGS